MTRPAVLSVFWGHDPFYLALARLWTRNWRHAGFSPILVPLHWANLHPADSAIQAAADAFPFPPDSRPFETACLRRWAAAAVALRRLRLDLALTTDLDVFAKHPVPSLASIAASTLPRAPFISGGTAVLSPQSADAIASALPAALPASAWFYPHSPSPTASDLTACIYLANLPYSPLALCPLPLLESFIPLPSWSPSPAFPLISLNRLAHSPFDRLATSTRYVNAWGATS
jgi:hypothetical protein